MQTPDATQKATGTPSEDTVKKYEALFTFVLPGTTKPQTGRIEVEAEDPIIAMAKANDEWNARTAPRDVRIREIPKEG